MRTGPDGLRLIRDFEGFSPVVYLCAAGYETIGYGHRLCAGEAFADGVSEAEAAALLAQDVAQAERAVLRLVGGGLAQHQFDALVSFTYNLGAAALQRSTLRQRAARGDHAGAAREFGRWVYAGGCRLRGLVRRRAAEAALYAA